MFNYVLKSRVFWAGVCISPIFYLVYTIFAEKYTANPAEFFLLATGNTALYFYLSTIYISCLNLHPALKKTVGLLKKKRKMLGITCFIYAVMHLGLYLADNSQLNVLLTNFKKPFILNGMSAILILLAMFITSFRLIKGILSVRQWKYIHSLTYIMPILLAFHITSKEKGDVGRAVMLFTPLFILLLYRLIKYVSKHRENLPFASFLK